MPGWTLPMEGGCRCDRVRVRVEAPPIFASACHCLGCQKMSASAFSLSLMVPLDGFAVTAGETELGGLHGEARHNFCGWCKTWMFTRLEMLGPFVNLRASVLDDHAWVRPYVDMYQSTKLPWVETGAPRGYPEFPPMEAFGPLLADYARWDGR